MVSSLPVEVEDLNTAAALPGTNNVPAVPGLDLTAALPGTDGIPALPGVVVVSDIPEAVNGTISGSVDNVNEQGQSSILKPFHRRALTNPGPYPIRCNGLHLFQNYIDQCRDMMSRQGNTLFIAKKGGIKLCPGPGNDASGSVHVTGRAWEDDKGKEARATGSEIAGAIQAIQAKCNHLGGELLIVVVVEKV